MAAQDKIYRSELIVSGATAFPVDMLRYDCAAPASESDSNLITASVNHETRGRQVVRLICFHKNPWWAPTLKRWDSFLWRVDQFVDHRGHELNYHPVPADTRQLV